MVGKGPDRSNCGGAVGGPRGGTWRPVGARQMAAGRRAARTSIVSCDDLSRISLRIVRYVIILCNLHAFNLVVSGLEFHLH